MHQPDPIYLPDGTLDSMIVVLDEALSHTANAAQIWNDRAEVIRVLNYLRTVRTSGSPTLAQHDNPEIRAMVRLVEAIHLGEKRHVTPEAVSFEATYAEVHRKLHLAGVVEADEKGFTRRFSVLLREHGWAVEDADRGKREGRALRTFSWAA